MKRDPAQPATRSTGRQALARVCPLLAEAYDAGLEVLLYDGRLCARREGGFAAADRAWLTANGPALKAEIEAIPRGPRVRFYGT